MYIPTCSRGFIVALIATALSGALAGCSLEEQSAPSFTGPSEFALSVSLTATPNQLSRDGSSQSVVTITVRDAQGNAVAGQSLNLTVPVNVPSGTTLSSSQVTTDASGHATVMVTAPVQDSIGNSIAITATPVGANLDGVLPRQVSISLTPTNSTRPSPSFTINPGVPEIGQAVTFNASGTTDEGFPCNENCTYSWDFGGEGTGAGRIVTHTFRAGGRYVVALTVTDAQGAAETIRQNVDVSTTGQPLPVSFTVACATPSPTAPCVSPVAGRALSFTATATPAANHRIVSYNWSWGDGTTSQTTAPGIQHTFATAGTFLVRLTVRDDFGQTSEASQVVTVGTGLTAEFSNSPAIAGQDTTFDASASFSASGTTIQLYTWDWGDLTSDESTASPTITHEFAAAGSFSVQLTITDSQGRTATQTRTITVAPAP